MEIHEGGDEEAPLVGRYCGNTLPAQHISSGNEVYVRFKTDHSISGTGFRIRYDLGKRYSIFQRTIRYIPIHIKVYSRN